MAGRDTSPTSTSSAHSSVSVHTEKQPGSRSSMSASPPHSTPPTSHGDEASVLSDIPKMDQLIDNLIEDARPETSADAHATPQSASVTPIAPNSEGRRSARSTRKSVVTYNVQILAGTAIHTPSKYLDKHHKNVLHGDIKEVLKTSTIVSPKKKAPRPRLVSSYSEEDTQDPAEEQLAAEAAQAAQRRTSSRVTDLRREAFRNLGAVGQAIGQTLTGANHVVHNALRRSASDSHLMGSVRNAGPTSPIRPRTARPGASDNDTPEREAEKFAVKPKSKEWLKAGLYIGQTREFDARLSEAQNRLKKKSTKVKENKVIPLPMFAGERLLSSNPLHEYRNFKLPFDTYHPLPRKIKVDGWVKLHRNRFIGDASALWKKDKQDSSSCYCEIEDGCGEDCHNRIMAYECDSTNCKLTPEQCGNRPFSQLKKRAKGNGYDYGVEVLHTEDRGYGVRAMRTFEPHQIIVEYAGEIITQAECERRMKQVYKRDKCYYLMSFDNKMIIDATRGTIARFVNHSCEPNCEMIKWTVSGEPRMALFAGSRGIMTGDELTYDYNFDPFSSKNIQECRCGTPSCRGVLGPKPKKPVPESTSLALSLLAGTKRKISAVFGGMGADDDSMSPKKRKLTAMQTAAITKAQNAAAAEKAAREKAEKDAAELDAQRDSRENRAMKRLVSEQMSTKAKKVMRKGTRVSMPATKTKSTKYTTVSVRRKSMPAPTSSKPITKPSRPAFVKEIVKRGTRLPKIRKVEPISSLKKIRKSLVRSATPEEVGSEEGEEESPNITPASLRSAAKKLMQSKLPFLPLNLNANAASSSRPAEILAVPDTEDEDVEEVEEEEEEEEDSVMGDDHDSDDTYATFARKEFVLARKIIEKKHAKKQQRVAAKLAAKTSLHKTAAGIKKNFTRGNRGRFGSSKTKGSKP